MYHYLLKPLLDANMQTTALTGNKNTSNPSDQPDDGSNEDVDNDVDECSIFPGQVCSHLCVDLPRGFRCDCPTGFTLTEDRRTCEFIDRNGLYQLNSGELLENDRFKLFSVLIHLLRGLALWYKLQ